MNRARTWSLRRPAPSHRPQQVIDCPDPYCGRLIHPLRIAAKTKDAKEILARAAVARYRARAPRVGESRAEFVARPGRTLRSRRHRPVRLRLLPRARPGRGGSQRAGEVEAGRGLPRASGRRHPLERRDQEDARACLQGGLGAPGTGQPPPRGARRSRLDRCHRRGRSAAPAGERRLGAFSAVRPDRAGRHHPGHPGHHPIPGRVPPVPGRVSGQAQGGASADPDERGGAPGLLRSARSHPSPETSSSSSTATAPRPKRRCRWSGRSSSRRTTEGGR